MESGLRKTSFKFEGTNPSTGKKFKIALDGFVPESVIQAVKDEIDKILSGELIKDDVPTIENFVEMDSLTIKHKIEIIILQNFRHGWFNTNDLIEQYNQRYNEVLKKTTAATNLQRLFRQEEILERKGNRAQHEYRLLVEKVESRLENLSKAIFIE